MTSKFKRIIISLIGFITISAIAQTQQTFNWQGKQYFVFSYTQEIPSDIDADYPYNHFARYSNYNNSSTQNVIPQHFSNLPDGDYIMFYAKPMGNDPKITLDLSKIVAATFSIKGNEKNGIATFYSYKHITKTQKQVITATGNLIENLRNGTWNFYNYQSTTGIKINETIINFKDGIYNGKFEYLDFQNPKNKYIKHFLNGESHGLYLNKNSYEIDSLVYDSGSIVNGYSEKTEEGIVKKIWYVNGIINKLDYYLKDNPKYGAYFNYISPDNLPRPSDTKKPFLGFNNAIDHYTDGFELFGKITCPIDKQELLIYGDTLWVDSVNLHFPFLFKEYKKWDIYKSDYKVKKMFNMDLNCTVQITANTINSYNVFTLRALINDKVFFEKKQLQTIVKNVKPEHRFLFKQYKDTNDLLVLSLSEFENNGLTIFSNDYYLTDDYYYRNNNNKTDIKTYLIL